MFITNFLRGNWCISTVSFFMFFMHYFQVQGKTLDQVTDMMVANAQNLIITVKPANQRNTLQRGAHSHISRWSGTSEDTLMTQRRDNSDDTQGPNGYVFKIILCIFE